MAGKASYRVGKTEAAVPNWSYTRASDRRAAKSAKWQSKTPGNGSTKWTWRNAPAFVANKLFDWHTVEEEKIGTFIS